MSLPYATDAKCFPREFTSQKEITAKCLWGLNDLWLMFFKSVPMLWVHKVYCLILNNNIWGGEKMMWILRKTTGQSVMIRSACHRDKRSLDGWTDEPSADATLEFCSFIVELISYRRPVTLPSFLWYGLVAPSLWANNTLQFGFLEEIVLSWFLLFRVWTHQGPMHSWSLRIKASAKWNVM